MSKTTLPSRTFECCPCEWTFFAGPRSGPGPFACPDCGQPLTLRPEGQEPYQGGASLPENTIAALPLFAQEAQ